MKGKQGDKDLHYGAILCLPDM